MPTDRFYRLADEKKRIIREAAIKEFARVPFEKASINQIIRNADISRGSFYTYFSDKQDVVSFIFEDAHAQIGEECVRILKGNNGDYFKMLQELFEFLASQVNLAQEMIRMVQNVFSYKSGAAMFGIKDTANWWKDKSEEHCHFQELFSYVNASDWWIKDIEDIKALIVLGFSALMLALSEYYEHPENIESVRSQLSRKLILLQRGVVARSSELG